MIRRAYLGEDVPIRAEYTDDADAAVDPDSAPTITITAPDDTEVISAVATTSIDVGVYEYVWDTAVDAAGAGEYEVTVEGEFSAETKIVKNTIELR